MKNLTEKIENFKNNPYENEISIFTTTKEWKNSSICWDDELTETDDYIYEVNFIENNLHVTCVPNVEFQNKVYNSDFSESIEDSDILDFFQELIENEEIFNQRF